MTTPFAVPHQTGECTCISKGGVTYENVSIVDFDENINVFGAGVKFRLIPDRLAFYLPVGFVSGADLDTGDTWTAVPTLLANVVTTRTFELVPSFKAFLPLTETGDREVFLGLHLGAGISNDLSKWAIRPEIGFVRDPDEDGTVWGWAIGFSFRP